MIVELFEDSLANEGITIAVADIDSPDGWLPLDADRTFSIDPATLDELLSRFGVEPFGNHLGVVGALIVMQSARMRSGEPPTEAWRGAENDLAGSNPEALHAVSLVQFEVRQ